MFRELIYRHFEVRPQDLEGLDEEDLREALKDKAEIDAALEPLYKGLAPFKTRQFWRIMAKEWGAIPILLVALFVAFLRNRHREFAADVFVMFSNLKATPNEDMSQREKDIDRIMDRLSAYIWGKV